MGAFFSSLGSGSRSKWDLSKYYIKDEETLRKLVNKKKLNVNDSTCRYFFEFKEKDDEFINLHTITSVNKPEFNSNSKYLSAKIADNLRKKYITRNVPVLENSDKDKIFLVYDYRKETCEILKKNGLFQGNKYRLFYIIGDDSIPIPLNGLYYLCKPESEIINKNTSKKSNIKNNSKKNSKRINNN